MQRMTKQETLDYLDEALEKSLRKEAIELMLENGQHAHLEESEILRFMELLRKLRKDYWRGLARGKTE
jgi:hypothetical protein